MTFGMGVGVGAKFVWSVVVLYELSAFVSGMVVNSLSNVPNCADSRYNCGYDMMMNVVFAGLFSDISGFFVGLYFMVCVFIGVDGVKKSCVMSLVGLFLVIAHCVIFVIMLDIYVGVTPGCEVCIRKSSYLFDFVVFKAVVLIFLIMLLVVILLYGLFVWVFRRCCGENEEGGGEEGNRWRVL